MAAGRFDLAVADELADFRRKGGPVDIEVVGELLAREGDFKRIASSRLGPHFQIGEQLFRRRVGVAMANAKDVVKEAADVITGSNDEDGLVPVIEKYVMI